MTLFTCYPIFIELVIICDYLQTFSLNDKFRNALKCYTSARKMKHPMKPVYCEYVDVVVCLFLFLSV